MASGAIFGLDVATVRVGSIEPIDPPANSRGLFDHGIRHQLSIVEIGESGYRISIV